MKTYDTFEEMMEELRGVTFEEAEEMGLTKNLKCLKGVTRTKYDGFDLEEFGDYAAIFACKDTNDMVKEIAETYNFQIVTYCTDPISFSTGMHFVNREKYLFCRSKDEGFCQEEEDDDEDSESYEEDDSGEEDEDN